MRIIAADWMGNASQIPGQVTRPKEEGGGVPVRFRTRATAPTSAQVNKANQDPAHCRRCHHYTLFHFEIYVYERMCLQDL